MPKLIQIVGTLTYFNKMSTVNYSSHVMKISFLPGIMNMLNSQELTEVSLAAGGKLFHVHKLVLSVASPYFRTSTKVPGAAKA